MKFPRCLLTLALGLLGVLPLEGQETDSWASREKTNFQPTIHHHNVEDVTLFAQNPDIVTPVGIAVAPDGRVFVQENHTHKRNANYQGPAFDRILVFEDTDGDGVADQRSIFYEGHTFSTDLLFGPDGHLYVSTRWFIGRFPNAANLKKAAGEPEVLVKCETDGDYPHNGVGGLAIDPANPEWLAFGFGENLGVDYSFVGSDGTRWSGGGEGGSTYRCRTDGRDLTRLSTGHWNAFGMAFDLSGNLFSTDNDPNATPPNRLLHVVPGADFGYEYRYGRSGRHPLVCWYGENPGTLGMIGALGEAACGLVPFGPGQLLSASWTDNRVDLHRLSAKGTSFTASREPLISGPDEFRPVHFSYSADGQYLYFTDWVKISYPVHGHGRIWRIKFKQPVRMAPLARKPAAPGLKPQAALQRLGSKDPYLRTQAIDVLQRHPDFLRNHAWQDQPSSIAQAHFAVAIRRLGDAKDQQIIPSLLEAGDATVRFVGIKWTADESLSQYRPNLERLLERPDLSRQDVRAAVAALARISGDSGKEFVPDQTLLQLALDRNRPPQIRALALQGVNVKHQGLTTKVLANLADEKNVALQREAVHALVLHANADKSETLARIAADENRDDELRADAIAGLSSKHEPLLRKLAQTQNATIAQEASRSLNALGLTLRKVEMKPPITDLAAWQQLIERAGGNADPAVGRRIFFRPTKGGCYKCHAFEGRGSSIGPDLTTIGNQSEIDQAWLLKHIVDPNAEMAPYYRPQAMVLLDGRVLTGLVVGKEGKNQAYVGSDGELFFVDKDEVDERKEMTTSIMPTGLLDSLSAGEIRDLIAYLLQSQPRAPGTGTD